MARVLLVGCGDLGTEIATQLTALQHDVTGIRITDKPLPDGMTRIQLDVTRPSSRTILEHLSPNIVIYCVAANAQTDDSYKSHYVDGLANVLASQSKNAHLEHVFFVSSTRVYGQKTAQKLDESMPPKPVDFGGERLLEAEALLNKMPYGTTAIRLSGIYGPGRLYLLNLAKQPARWSSSNKWTNRIHRDDAARLIVFLTKKAIEHEPLEKCYIGTDDMPTLQHDVLRWLAKQMSIDVPVLQSEGEIGGKQLSNQRIRKAGFDFMYPNYQIGYQVVLNDCDLVRKVDGVQSH